MKDNLGNFRLSDALFLAFLWLNDLTCEAASSQTVTQCSYPSSYWPVLLRSVTSTSSRARKASEEVTNTGSTSAVVSVSLLALCTGTVGRSGEDYGGGGAGLGERLAWGTHAAACVGVVDARRVGWKDRLDRREGRDTRREVGGDVGRRHDLS